MGPDPDGVASATPCDAPDEAGVAEATPPAGARLHRNNAAEWLMLIVLTPIAWIIRGWHKSRTKKSEPSGSAAGASAAKKSPPRPVMIEGLPPRTMN